MLSIADTPMRAVPGNHDIDYDATHDEHSFDTYKREIGPEHHSYHIGDTHFVGLDDVKYPVSRRTTPTVTTTSAPTRPTTRPTPA